MKRLFLALGLLVSMVSCYNPENELPKTSVTYTSISKDSVGGLTIIKYEFENHKYQFHGVGLNRAHGYGGPVHDPDCPCLKDSIK